MRTRLTELLGVAHPIVAAPMAGGPTTPQLVAAVAEAGGLGSLAGAMLPPDELRAAIRTVRDLTSRPFAVNLFAPLPPPDPRPGVVEAVQAFLAPERERLGLPQPAPPEPRGWPFEQQLAVVLEERVPVFSFTFGIPPLDALRDVVTIGTATTAVEAAALEDAGVDVVLAQGAEAGGHRGGFLDHGLVPLAELVPEIVARVSVPVLAAGGIVDGSGIADAIARGAAGTQLGTAFLYSDESGASDSWKRALREHETLVTDRYSGRSGRAARTPFLDRLATVEPAPYPLQAQLLADLRGVPGYGFYLGGTAAPRARELPAGDLVRVLVEEAEAALR